MRGGLSPRVLIALSVAVAALAAAPFAWRSELVRRRRAAIHLGRARAEVASGRLDEARGEFRAALRLQPGDAAGRRQLAEMELSRGNRDLALLEFQTLAEMHPEDPAAWISLAATMSGYGWLEAPEAALDRAIEVAPEDGDAHLRRGAIRLRLGRYAGARADAEAAVAARPDDEAAWTLLVQAKARSQDSEAALDAARRAIGALGRRPALVHLVSALERRDETAEVLGPPPAPPPRLRPDAQADFGRLGAWTREHWPGRLGELRESLEAKLKEKSWAEAQRIVDSARAGFPDSSFAPFLAGTLDLARDDAKAAEKQFQEALAIAPRLPVVVAALGRTWARTGGAAGAARQLMQLAERDPGLASARYMAARAYVEARDPVAAEAALRRGVALQPGSPVPYQHLTDFYFGLDRTPEALEICQQGVERFPRASDLQLMLAQISVAIGRTDEAIRIYGDLLARRPDLDLIRYKLAVLLASREGDAADRERLSRIASELRNDAPSDPLFLDALGWVLFKAGDRQRARQVLEAAVREVPEEPGVHFHLAALYLQERERERARGELKVALDSPRPFAERLDALRLLRDTGAAPAADARRGRR